MTFTRGQIEALVMRVQDEFLGAPTLTLSAAQAARRFKLDVGTSKAILDALVVSRVLARTTEGAYARLFPRRVPGMTLGRAHAA